MYCNSSSISIGVLSVQVGLGQVGRLKVGRTIPEEDARPVFDARVVLGNISRLVLVGGSSLALQGVEGLRSRRSSPLGFRRGVSGVVVSLWF